VRYGYFKRRLEELHLTGQTVLDVGLWRRLSGGGIRPGRVCRNRDRSGGSFHRSGAAACRRQQPGKSTIAWQGEALPFPDGSFDVVACCDVLEHVDDLSLVISEVARTLKAGGVFCFDTVNRTWLSNLVVIKISQDWASPVGPNQCPCWRKFIKPAELMPL